jgi:hypothetical protein
VLLAVLVGLARGGKWNNLVVYKFKKIWLVVMALAMQLLVFNTLWDRYIGQGRLSNILYGLSIIILMLFVLANADMKGLRLLGAGVFLNGVAIVANGGSMPSSLEGLKNILPAERIDKLLSGLNSYNVVLINENTKFKYFCDIFYIPGVNVYSIGDLFIAVGAFVVIQQIMLRSNGTNISIKVQERR